ncbi:MAG: hypothetical protein ACTSQJ_05495, partial [Promethearchaeota archaeon]
TYFKDIEYNKIYVRTFLESYTPYILYELFKEDSDFQVEKLIENWIKFSRLLLNSILNIISSRNFNPNDFNQFKPESELEGKPKNFEKEKNNFSFSALHYETIIAKDLYPIHNDLFNIPPSNFEVINSINYYTTAEELIKNYRFEDATKLLNDSLKIFNKNRQKKVVVSILLKLRKIASILKQGNIALNYLKTALGVAKSGEVPINYIIKIHYMIGKHYYKLNDFKNALNHFNIIINFLENEKEISSRDIYLGLSYLYIGLIYSENEQYSKSKENFKKAFQFGNKYTKIKLKYFLFRAIDYKNKGNFSQSYKLLKTGIDTIGIDSKEEEFHIILLDLILELAEYYIHHRKESKRSKYLLTNAEKYLEGRTIKGIVRNIRWNLLMSDYYNFLLKDRQNSQYYLKQSRILKGQLQSFGVLD